MGKITGFMEFDRMERPERPPLNRLEDVTEGSVLFAGQKLGDLKQKELRHARQQIAMIFQHFNLLSQRTVIQNVMMPMKIAKYDRKQQRSRAEEVNRILSQFGPIIRGRIGVPDRDSGLAVIGLIVSLIVAAVRRRGHEDAKETNDEDFVSYYDHDGTVQ